MDLTSLSDKFKKELEHTYPDFEILDVVVHNNEKCIIIEAKAKENFVTPIGKVLHMNFEKRNITSWESFAAFQFYREMVISGEDVVPKGGRIPSVAAIRGTKSKGMSKS